MSRITWMNFPPYNTFTSVVYTTSMASCDQDSTKLATTFQPSRFDNRKLPSNHLMTCGNMI